MIQISRDGGRTFGAEIWHSLGAVGKYKTRVAQRRCGTARDFVFRFAMTDPVKFVMTGMACARAPSSRGRLRACSADQPGARARRARAERRRRDGQARPWLEFLRSVFYALFGWRRSFTAVKTFDFPNIVAGGESRRR
jgi:hypothetical protein